MNEIAQNVYPNKPKLTSFYFVWFAIEILQAIKRIRFFRRSSCSHNSENKILRRLFRSNNRVFITTAERKKKSWQKKHVFLSMPVYVIVSSECDTNKRVHWFLSYKRGIKSILIRKLWIMMWPSVELFSIALSPILRWSS